jgi:hypothetical protein
MAAKDTGPDLSAPEIPDPPKPDDDLAKRVQDLETRLAAAQAMAPPTLIPVHGGGPGGEIAETWSLADQEAAKAG